MTGPGQADELAQELYNALASVFYLCSSSLQDEVPEVARLVKDALGHAHCSGVCANKSLLMHPVRELDGYEFAKK